MTSLRWLYFIFLVLMIKFTDCINIKDFEDPFHRFRDGNGGEVVVQHSLKSHVNLRDTGIFETFLKNLLDLLTTDFPERKLPRYVRLLNRHLKEMDYLYSKRLAKHLRELSRMYREDLKNELKSYRQNLDKEFPHKTEFLNAMNAVFTLKENLLFNDYIYDLRDYGNKDKLYIDDETHKLLNDVIVGSIMKMSFTDRKQLFNKLKKAVKEYRN